MARWKILAKNERGESLALIPVEAANEDSAWNMGISIVNAIPSARFVGVEPAELEDAIAHSEREISALKFEIKKLQRALKAEVLNLDTLKGKKRRAAALAAEIERENNPVGRAV